MKNSVQNNSFSINGGIREKKSSRHWRTLDDTFSLQNKPKKIVVLPGNASVSAKEANGMCKIVESFLDPNRYNYELCGFYYSDNSKTQQSVIERADSLLNYFIPLIGNKNKFGDLERLSFDSALKNMRNVVVVTHCYGSRIIDAVTKELSNVMKDIGYQNEEIKSIQRQLFVLHQNTPVTDLGKSSSYSSNLYRITQADENNPVSKYSVDSFPYYLLTEEMTSDEVLLSKLSANEQALIVSKISNSGESEHNGAYWSPNGSKTQAGKKEDTFCKAILNEAVFSNYLIENMQQLLQNTMKKDPFIAEDMQESIEYGQEFSDDYHNYVKEVAQENNQIKIKIKKETLKKDDLDKISEEALFLTDKDGVNLLGYAVKEKNYEAAGLIWHNMKKAMPKFDASKDNDKTFKNESADIYEAFLTYKTYVQQAIDSDNMTLFKEIVTDQDKDIFGFLDLSHKEGETFNLAKKMYKKSRSSKYDNLRTQSFMHD